MRGPDLRDRGPEDFRGTKVRFARRAGSPPIHGPPRESHEWIRGGVP